MKSLKKQSFITCFLIAYIFFIEGICAFQIQSIIPDSITTKSPNQLIELIQLSNPNESKVYEIALYNLSDRNLILAQQQYKIASFFYNKEEYERCIYFLKKAIEIDKAKDDPFFFSILYLKLGNAYLKEWQNQKSLDAYYNALSIAQAEKSIEQELIANSGIAIILRRMEQLDKALKICKNSLFLTENSSDKNTINHVRIFTIISEIYLDQKKYDSVLQYTDVGIKMAKSLDYPIGSIDLHTKKGAVYLYKNELPKAYQCFYKAEEILLKKEVTQKKSILNLNYFLANCFYKEKKYEKAISYLNKNISIIEENDTRNIRVLETYILLANCYTEIGNTNEAIPLFQKLHKLREQFQDSKEKTITKLHNQDIDDLENQIKKHKTQETKQEHYKEIIFFVLLLVSTVLVIITFTYFKNKKKEKKRFNRLLEKISALESKKKKNPKPVVINDQKVNTVLEGLRKLENQEYFLNTDCDLRSMSKKVKTNTTYLSKIIKIHKANSFNDYINDLRIEYALKRLKNDKKFRSFSIKSIALEIGYKTDNSFTKHFKSKTGLYPSYYIKKINDQEY